MVKGFKRFYVRARKGEQAQRAEKSAVAGPGGNYYKIISNRNNMHNVSVQLDHLLIKKIRQAAE